MLEAVVLLAGVLGAAGTEDGNASDRTEVQVPLEVIDGWPGVRVWLGDREEPFLFLLDTGSNGVVLFDTAARELAVPVDHMTLVQTFAGAETVAVGEPLQIAISPESKGYRYVQPLMLPGEGALRSLSAQFVETFDGIAGLDAFARSNMEFHLGGDASLHVAYEGIISAVLQVTVPALQVSVNGIGLTCGLDTGAQSNGLWVRAHAEQAAQIVDSADATLTRPSPRRSGTVDRLLVGDVSLGGQTRRMLVRVEQPVTEISQAVDGLSLDSTDMPACVLGADEARAMRITYDLTAGTVTGEFVSDPVMRINRTGIALTIWTGETLQVTEIDPVSPAQEMGLAPGDHILAFDGEALSDAQSVRTFSDAMFDSERDSLDLTVERQGERLEVRLALRDML
jgi:hypothetical protein